MELTPQSRIRSWLMWSTSRSKLKTSRNWCEITFWPKSGTIITIHLHRVRLIISWRSLWVSSSAISFKIWSVKRIWRISHTNYNHSHSSFQTRGSFWPKSFTYWCTTTIKSKRSTSSEDSNPADVHWMFQRKMRDWIDLVADQRLYLNRRWSEWLTGYPDRGRCCGTHRETDQQLQRHRSHFGKFVVGLCSPPRRQREVSDGLLRTLGKQTIRRLDGQAIRLA